MKYIELTVHTSTIGSELISDIFWEFSNEGVAISDVNDVIALSKLKRNAWDYIDDDVLNASSDVLCKGYIPVNEEYKIPLIENKIRELGQNSELPLGSLETVKREIEGDEWLERWKEHFKPIHIGSVTVCPEWIPYEPQKGETVTKIDSNMAFGTGEHETTSMCIELLQQFINPDATVIDVGCGSGILGITASKLGAKNVLMTDIDECAVEASEHNCKINCVANCTPLLKNLLDDQTLKGDIILANIMAEVLVAFSPNIGKNLNDNGIIILSGILNTKLNFVLDAYTKAGFSLIKTLQKGEWSAVAMRGNV